MERLLPHAMFVNVCHNLIKYGYDAKKEFLEEIRHDGDMKVFLLNPNFDLNRYIKEYGREYVRDHLDEFNHPAVDVSDLEPVVFTVPDIEE